MKVYDEEYVNNLEQQVEIYEKFVVTQKDMIESLKREMKEKNIIYEEVIKKQDEYIELQKELINLHNPTDEIPVGCIVHEWVEYHNTTAPHRQCKHCNKYESLLSDWGSKYWIGTN